MWNKHNVIKILTFFFFLWEWQTLKPEFPSDFSSCHVSSMLVNIVPAPSIFYVTSQALCPANKIAMVCLVQPPLQQHLSLCPAWHPILQHQQSAHAFFNVPQYFSSQLSPSSRMPFPH